jgi:putative flavoprotein involved in K+ transport
MAHELAGRHPVILATGHARRLLTERILGQSTWWWLDKLGLVRLSGATALGRYMQKADPFPGKGNTLHHLQEQGVRVLPKLVTAHGHTVTSANGATAEVSAVIWATGYRDNSAWVAVPAVKDAQGNFVQQRGVAPLPYFYFIGRPWQRSRGSALLTGVGADAAWLTDRIVTDLGKQKQPDSVVPRPPPVGAWETEAALER